MFSTMEVTGIDKNKIHVNNKLIHEAVNRVQLCPA